ncbi:hypothetical protein EUGRSUZ_E02438 [Eucalyptus grandis]|uniref:non-specific serine/threonine protein kinase n=2 Tax=Eucalyptus grandis TaxID=71139 RepID=A0A059C650_EUCGR|nr:hypothetical protein EUGRSUZ_E02438 [Eucalyptus grandis]
MTCSRDLLFLHADPNRDNNTTVPCHCRIKSDIIYAANANFSNECILGEGGFGPAYKISKIAVKRLSRTSGQGLIELKNEVILTARLQNRNLVQLLGCCLEELENTCSTEAWMSSFSKMRMNITCGIARGLLYLHEDSCLRIIHRDLKIDEMNPKISNFRLARNFDVNQDEANTSWVIGTYGYMAPVCAMEGRFAVKSYVFSFGVLLLEIVSGQKYLGSHLQEHGESLLNLVWKLWLEGRGWDLVDPLIKESCDKVEEVKYIHIGGDTIPLTQPLQPAFSVATDVTTLDPIDLIHNASTIYEVTLSDASPR